ncbi:MAG: NAD(+) diphosphatase [Gammaproteobacteria bacterium]
MEYSARNRFVSQTFDRLATRRADEDWRVRVLDTDRALILALWRHKVPAGSDGELHFLAPSHIQSASLDHAILLGVWNGLPCFALDMGQQEEVPIELASVEHHTLRSVGALAQADAAALAAYAQAMVFWQRRHRFCGTCGERNDQRESGHVLTCSRCANKQFPRSDPAVIVLVARHDKALLGRQATWPPGMYSTIAGFVEPGESLENAVRREVAEETGVTVDTVHYHSSQPWPFPASLMLGFHATATSQPTTLRDDELEDVRWFSREDIIAGLDDGLLTMSAPISIAYRLIEHWFDQGNHGALADHLKARAG